MIQTVNGCYFTPIKVHPKNWKQTSASVKKDWYLYYRFYDPTVVDDNGRKKPLLVMIKGMNKFKTLQERRAVTQELMSVELRHLTQQGWNPIISKFMVDQEEIFEGDIHPDTPFIDALRQALPKLTIGHRTRVGIKSVIKGVEKAAIQLRLQQLPVSQIGRRHIKKILTRCEEIQPKFSDGRFNAYRAYLLMLFNELVEQEAVTGNPIRDIKKRTVVQRIKPVLDPEQREKIDQHLKEVFPKFQAFVHLFFHSGGRKTELFQLKPYMVDLVNQRYQCVIRKRKRHTEVYRTIKDIAIPFWEIFLKDCPDDHYLFGPRFEPRLKPMGVDMPSRYWSKYVKADVKKGGLGIAIDFYSLKHLNTTEVVDALDEKAAAHLNAQTSTAMVVSIYDVKQKERQHEKLKRVANPFA